MSKEIILTSGIVYDPLNGIDGEVKDVCISDGKIVDKVSEKAKRIDMSGKAVLPGGVDMHSHIVGSKVNFGRAMCPDYYRVEPPISKTKITRSGVGGVVPSSYILGYRYSSMGYTTVVEPALPPMKALGTWEELEDIPNLNTALLPMFGNNMITYNYVKEGDISGLAGFISWLLKATGGWGVKVVNPGGTYAWAYGKNVREPDTEVPEWGITPREIIRSLVQATEALGLPHVVHLHPNNLGRIGNIHTTIEELDAVKDIKGHNGRKHTVHLTHMSFETLDMVEDGKPEWKDVASGGLEFAKYMNKNKHFTADMGQITFGPAMTMTGDGPFQFTLHQMQQTKWANIPVDVELPGGAGIVPYNFDIKSPANSVQWTIPLEFALSVDDIWRVILTTDHPNAGPFTKYPLVISWLMSKVQRDFWLDKVHKFARERSTLEGIEREWTFYETVISTRAAPAKILGIEKRKGHLGVGADADISVYALNPLEMELAKKPELIVKGFQEAALTILGGEIVAKKGKVVKTPNGKVFSIAPQLGDDLTKRVDTEVERMIRDWYSHSFRNYSVPERYREHLEEKIAIDSRGVTA
ncbi:MAG: formylmethanofuran dehydrogenase subunit A [Candidatus Thorarchaeota archaeon]|nr:formylmethanofuran dehydrogenase subunit A [Candidatus Thorarchaeota archaeon]